MNKVTKEQYEFALARIETLLPLVNDFVAEYTVSRYTRVEKIKGASKKTPCFVEITGLENDIMRYFA